MCATHKTLSSIARSLKQATCRRMTVHATDLEVAQARQPPESSRRHDSILLFRSAPLVSEQRRYEPIQRTHSDPRNRCCAILQIVEHQLCHTSSVWPCGIFFIRIRDLPGSCYLWDVFSAKIAVRRGCRVVLPLAKMCRVVFPGWNTYFL